MRQELQEAIIRREFDHSFLFIKMKSLQTEAYPFMMITKNDIPGLLNCRIRYIEEVPYYSYDISSKKPLTQEYQNKKLYFEDVKELFYKLFEILRKADEFLLDKEGFLLVPEYIYKGLETEDLFCLYLPCQENGEDNEKERYRELADFLLDKADHKDEHAVNCVYQFYKMSKEVYFSFEAFLGFLNKEELMLQSEKKRLEERKNIEERKEVGLEEVDTELDLQENFLQIKERRKCNWLIPMILGLLGLVLSALYLFIPYLRYFALFFLLPGITLIVISLLFFIRNVYVLYQKRQESEWIAPIEPVTVEEYFDDVLDNETVYFENDLYYHLKWKEGHFSKEFYLKELPVTVGKMKGSVGLCIEDASVSRLHACFKEQGKGIILQDLDSTNGTYINGKRLAPGEEMVVNRSDEIQFGKIIVNVV